ncbi:MAG: DUF1349 domain-containing protein, partial [Chlorobiales bacterium]|nr:DUF1349 domain-containing protein [Chlorobiales bacterium]
MQNPSAVWARAYLATSFDAKKYWITSGFLRIVTQSPIQNVLVQPAPGADFEIRTRVVFTPTVNFQFAGLVLWQDELNNLKLGRAFCDLGAPNCSNNA